MISIPLNAAKHL